MQKSQSKWRRFAPIIAMVLLFLVAGVVLAVSYVLVSAFGPTRGCCDELGINIRSESEGNYTVMIFLIHSSLHESDFMMSATRDGTVLIGSVPVDSMSCLNHGAVWVPIDPSSTVVMSGDRITLSGVGTGCPGAPGNEFRFGDSIEISTPKGILWAGSIR